MVLSCDDYKFLLLAGPERKDMPPCVQKLMDAHSSSCKQHDSPAQHQGDIKTPVNPWMEQTALELVKKLEQEHEKEKTQKEAIALNDRTEMLLDKILRCHARGEDSLIYVADTDSLWLALKDVRKKAGRELPQSQ